MINYMENIMKKITMEKKYPDYFEKIFNKNLFEQIIEFSILDIPSVEFIDKSKGIIFAKEYNLKYFGEMLERYEERNIVKDIKDFRTLIFAVNGLWTMYDLETVDNQYTKYIKDTLKKINNNFDTLTAVLFIDTIREDKIIKLIEMEDMNYFNSNYSNLIDKINNSISSLNNIEEELIILSIMSREFYVLSLYNNDFENKEFQEKYINNLNNNRETLNKLIEKIIFKLNNVQTIISNTDLYEVLCDVYELLKPKAKDFDIKGVSQFLLAFRNLNIKELTEIDKNRIKTFIPNIPEKEIYFLNYYFANYKNNINKKITSPGYIRISENLVEKYLADDKQINTKIEAEIQKIIIENNFIIFSVFSNNCIKNKYNYKFCIDMINKFKSSDNCFVHFNKKHKFIIEDMYYFNLLKPFLKSDLILSLLSVDKTSKEDMAYLIGLCKQYKIDYMDSYKIFEKIVNYSLFNIYDFELINKNTNLLKYTFKYVNKQGLNSKKKYIDEYIQKINLQDINKVFLEINDSFFTKEIYEINDVREQQKFLKYYDKLILIKKPHIYDEHIYNNLNNCLYTDVLEITNEEKTMIFNKMVEYKLLPEDIRKKLRLSLMTDEEKEVERVNNIITCIEEQDSVWRLNYTLNKMQQEDINNSKIVKSIKNRIKTIVSQGIRKLDIDELFPIIRMLCMNGYMNKEELFDLMTKEIKVVNK